VRELVKRIDTFVDRYNATFCPFIWTATADLSLWTTTADSILALDSCGVERLSKAIYGTRHWLTEHTGVDWLADRPLRPLAGMSDSKHRWKSAIDWQCSHCVLLNDALGQLRDLARRYSQSQSQVRFRQERSGVAEKTINVAVPINACVDHVRQERADLGRDRAR
jgi:hypothetical protein